MSDGSARNETSQSQDQGRDQGQDRRALLHNALSAIESLEARLAAAEAARNEPIAVVGMSCRLPGGIESPDGYWQLLVEKRDAITHFPAERQRIAEAFGYPENTENVSQWQGGFVGNIEQFDPQFFGISPREAVTMDPQQRLVLEVAWEALERAGQAPDQLVGSPTGVYLGISTNDYGQVVRLGGYEEMDPYSATGGSMNVAAGRLAFTLGFQGPCLAVDTACSSSLVAVHLAMQDLRNGNCSMALAGGVNIVLMADGFVAFDKWGMTAPNGRSKAFDASADGFVRAEGCGMIVLKRLSDALANGDTILALLRGSAVNQDGRSSGLTVPNGLAQQEMLRKALSNAAIAPADVQYIEAHGTGTPIGDPIEVEAIGAVLGEGRPIDRPLFLSSVKTNIGHLESASGIAGMIKVILSMQHGQIAPLLHLKQRSPQIPWPAFPIEIPTEPTPWPAVEGRRIAGISGFGFSGTNAHIVLESAPSLAPAPAASPAESLGADAKYYLLPLSGRNQAGLAALAARYARHLADHPELDLADVCNTTALGRSHFAQRAAFVAANTEQMAQRLAAFAQESGSPQPETTAAPRVAFLFTGQGSQYAGMGAALYAHAPVFRAALDRCAAILADKLDYALLDIILDAANGAAASAYNGIINQTACTQPALFALEYALSELWRSWGITPVAVLGHSVGEYVAAVIAGVMSLEDGLTLIAERGRLMQALPAGGAMAAIFAPSAQVQTALAAHSATLAVAAINGPAHTVISGADAAVSQVADMFAADGVRVQRLTVSHAFHSPLMDPILEPFAQAAGAVAMRTPRIPLISNVTGKVAGQEITRASYWRQHVRGAVEFNASMETLHQLGVDVLLEIGPQPVLLGMARAMPFLDSGSDTSAGKAPSALPSLRKGHDDWEQMLSSLGALYARGAAVRWPALAARDNWHKLSLPTYPFQRRRYWVGLPARKTAAAMQAEGHPLLGRRVRSPLLRETIYETVISAERPAYLADHRVQHQVIFPGSAYVEMALAAAASFAANDVAVNLSLRAMFALTDAQPRTLQLLLAPSDDAHASVRIVSSPAGPESKGWADEIEDFTLHAEGALERAAQIEEATIDLAAIQARLEPGAMDTDAYYADMDEQGLDYGPAFRCLAQLFAGEGEALGAVTLPAANADEASEYQFHPALLDGCFHVIGAAMRTLTANSAARQFYVPLEFEGVRVYKPGAANVWCYVTIAPGHDGPVQAGAEIISAQLHIVDAAGSPVASVERLHLRLMKNEGISRRTSTRYAKWLYDVAWQAQPLAPPDINDAQTDDVHSGARWLIFADDNGMGEALAARLRATGATCTLLLAEGGQPQVNSAQMRVNPSDRAIIKEIIDAESTDGPLQGVVYLWALNGSQSCAEDDTARLEQINSGAFHLVQALAACAERAHAPRLFLGTRGAQSVDGEAADPVAAMLWGLGRSISNELPALHCTLIDMESSRILASEMAANALADELLANSSETQVALRGGARYVARLAHHHAAALHPGQPQQLVLGPRGKLEALAFAPLERVVPHAGQVEVAVRATGLNFRDVLNVLGMYPGDPGVPGLECAGIVTAVGADVTHVQPGDSVLALATRAFDSYVLADGALTTRLPKNLTFAEAVTLPSAYLTATYGLNNLAKLQPGERILIHAAAGGVGIAAVALAQRAGAEIFATAGSEEKHAFLRAQGVRHIYSSRTLDFADQIMADTNGAGMDVILNSLADAFLERSMDLLAPHGRFLEIGKRGIWTEEQFAAAHPEGAYYPYDPTSVLLSEPAVIHAMLESLMREIAQGSLKPLPLRAFPAEDIIDAFRFMAQAKHIGKVVVTHNPARVSELVHADAGYLITGGLGGLGLSVAQWLAVRGARHLTLVGRSQPGAAAETTLAALRAGGVAVQVLAADISRRDDVARVLETMASTQPPLRGIIHAAGILDDGIIQQQEWARYARVFGPKVEGARHLHELTRTLPLDFFVLFSSASAILGAAGQSNYAAANAALDMLAHERRAAGLPALSINWGAWSDVGMAAALGAHDQQRVAAQGIAMIQPQQGVAVLEQLLADSTPEAIVLPIHWPTLRARLLDGNMPAPFFADMLEENEGAAADAPRIDALESVRNTATADTRMSALVVYITDRVMRVLALDSAHTPSFDQRLVEIGMDSLMAVELRNRLEADLHVSLSLTSLFEGATIHTLAGEINAQLAAAELSAPADAQVVTPTATPPGAEEPSQKPKDLLSHLSEMSDADVDALLTEMLNREGTVDES